MRISWRTFVAVVVLGWMTSCTINERTESVAPAIALCIKAYETYAATPFPSAADRALIDDYPDSMVIHFEKGESGLFSTRDSNHQRFFRCGVEKSRNLTVYNVVDLAESRGPYYSSHKSEDFRNSQLRYLEGNRVETCWFQLDSGAFKLRDCRKWN